MENHEVAGARLRSILTPNKGSSDKHKYTKEYLEKRVRELAAEQPWSHNIELPFGVRTRPYADDERHGKSLGKWKRLQPYLLALDLSGKRVLDVGCNEGFFSLKCGELGALEVVGVDINPHRIEKARFVLEVLQPSNVSVVQRDLYNPEIESLGTFDMVLCLGLLHRVPNPYGAIQAIGRLADQIVLEWTAFEDTQGRSLLWYNQRVNEDDPDNTAYFFPTVDWVEGVLHELGFVYQFVDDDSPWKRTIVIASRYDGPLFRRAHNRRRVARPNLLLKYTRQYLSNIKGVLTGRITV